MQRNASPPSIPPGKSHLPRSRQGVALVVVLAIIVLITGLVVAFFSTVTNELTAAKSYAGGSSAKQLADSATQLAIGTIRKATSQTKDKSGTDVAWASQPGMIRTWDNNGSALTCYKLFSSDDLETTPPYDNAKDFDSAFDSKPALFTDLNAPILDASNAPHYPVVDPRAALDSAEQNLSSPQIQGFSIDTSKVPAVNSVKYSPAIAYAPMPVRWMYVLQDGTLSTPTSGTTTATFGGTNAPTPANPIVGRIAYWTDDDSCKVNINTASEGVYWDMPHLLSREDVGLWNGTGTRPTTRGLAICQPAAGEYQRYPGHPATTSLSPILAFGTNPLLSTLTVPTPTASSPVDPITASNYTEFEPYYDLVPRVTTGGSHSGVVIPSTNTANGGNLMTITTDNDRLFASVDEFLFKQPASTDSQRQIHPSVLTSSNTGNSVTPAGVTRALEEAKFFLTAHSSAPEVTTFNTPRISMWPVWATGAGTRTTLDSTLAFCANLQSGGTDKPFYFTRADARSTTKDYTGSTQNQALYNYLLKLMSLPVPGFGGTFNSTAALGSLDSTQVITSVYDYIRCINMHDTSSGATPYVPNVTIGGAAGAIYGGGEVLPIRIQNTSFPGGHVGGFGRYLTVSGMDIAFCGVPAANAKPGDTTTARVQAILVPTLFSPMQGLPGMFPKMYYTIDGQQNFTLGGVNIFKPGGTTYIANAPVQDTLGRGMGSMISPRASLEAFGPFLTNDTRGYEEKRILAGDNTAASNPPGSYAASSNGSGVFPFVSYYATDSSPNIPLPLPQGGGSPTAMSFTGGVLTVKLYSVASGSDPSELLQTIYINMPSATLPVPSVIANGVPFFGTYTSPTYTAGQGRFNFRTNDVVRGVEVAGPGDAFTDTTASTNTSAGDVRQVAALEMVGSSAAPSYYHAHQNWASQTLFVATGIEDDDGSNDQELADGVNVVAPQGNNQHSAAGSHGALASKMSPRGGSGSNLYQYKSPYVPSRTYTSAQAGVTRTNGVASTPGDWDTGFALLADGAHINMGDIGDGEYVDQVQWPYPGFAGQHRYPYAQKEDHFNSNDGAGTYFSPNRQVPSSMVLGSIPTGIHRQQPWQTLLFNPKPDDLTHPGRRLPVDYSQPGTVPPDHLIADLFWMPVVQPYPISQPFSTAGKINMNYRIEPFNYITRASGIYALMKATKMMAIPASIYSYGHDPKALISGMSDITTPLVALAVAPDKTFRYPIDVDKTLAGFTDKFVNQKDIFRSASQIAELNLVPLGASGNLSYINSDMANFWSTHTMTGDNLREKPYVDLYPRLTTKSNAYTVHFRVQILQKVPGTDANQWVEGRDQIISEYRGSSEIERYLDSSASNLPDFASLMATSPTSPKLNLDNYYRYRVVSTKRFSPY